MALGAVLIGAAAAQADLYMAGASAAAMAAPIVANPANPAPVFSPASLRIDLDDPELPADLATGQPWAEPDCPAESVRELPGLPGSSSLFLSAMLSIGAWHVVRRAGQLHLSCLPEWYHPNAPHQVGHSVAFDPVAGFGFLPVCLFEMPAAPDPPRFPETRRELPSRHESQHFLTVESPRGPPCLCS